MTKVKRLSKAQLFAFWRRFTDQEIREMAAALDQSLQDRSAGAKHRRRERYVE